MRMLGATAAAVGGAAAAVSSLLRVRVQPLMRKAEEEGEGAKTRSVRERLVVARRQARRIAWALLELLELPSAISRLVVSLPAFLKFFLSFSCAICVMCGMCGMCAISLVPPALESARKKTRG